MEKSIPLSDIQSYWEIPAIAHFFKVFKKTLSFKSFYVEDLERALLDYGKTDGNLIDDVILCLLKGYFGFNIPDVDISRKLKSMVEIWCNENKDTNLLVDSEFQDLSLKHKIQVVFILCHMWMESYDLTSITDRINLGLMKAVLAGSDSQQSDYWFFHDTRLYVDLKPQPLIPKRRGRLRKIDKENERQDDTRTWKLLCETEKDWTELIEKLEKCTTKSECQLGSNLNSVYEDSVLPSFVSKGKEMRRRLLQKTESRESCRLAMKKKVIDDLLTKELMLIEKRMNFEKNLRLKHDELRKKELMLRQTGEREKRALNRQQILSARARRAERGRNGKRVQNNEESTDGPNLWEIRSVVCDLIIEDDCWLFIDPVDECFAPDYYSIIKDPICIKDIINKIESKAYTDVKCMEEDFNIMIFNCLMYYTHSPEYRKIAFNIYKKFMKSFKRNRIPLTFTSSRKMYEFYKNLYQTNGDSPAPDIDDKVDSSQSECSSSSSESSSSDYEGFENIITKRPRLNGLTKSYACDTKKSNQSSTNSQTELKTMKTEDTSLKPNDGDGNFAKKSPAWAFKTVTTESDHKVSVKLNNIFSKLSKPNQTSSFKRQSKIGCIRPPGSLATHKSNGIISQS